MGALPLSCHLLNKVAVGSFRREFRLPQQNVSLTVLVVAAKKSVVIPGVARGQEVARRQGARPRLAEGGACAPLREAWKSVAASARADASARRT